MKIKERKQQKEFIFNNKYVKNKTSLNDKILKFILVSKYKLNKKLKIFDGEKNKGLYEMLDCFYNDEKENFKNRDNIKQFENIDLKLEKIIIYDLLPKEYLNIYLKKYIKFKNLFSKESPFYRMEKDIREAFTKMSNSRVEGCWFNLDYFWIKENTSLSENFNKLRLEAIGLSQSFYILKYEISINDFANEELKKILYSNVYKEPEFISNGKWYLKNSFAGIKTFDINNEAKNCAIEDYILELKSIFFNEIRRRLISKFFNWKEIIPSIEIYSSSTLKEKEKEIISILYPHGFRNVEISKDKKTYFVYSNSLEDKKIVNSSKIIVDSKELENDGHGFYKFQKIEEILTKYLADYFLLDGLEYKISKIIYSSQLKINKNIYYKSRFNSLLNIKLKVERDLYFYKRLYKEIAIKMENKKNNKYVFNEYKKIFESYFNHKDPNLNDPFSFEYEYDGVYYKIKEKNDLINTIYSHFDENSRMIESLYNYKIVKWTLIIAALTLLATIFLANNSEILNQIIEFVEKCFKR